MNASHCDAMDFLSGIATDHRGRDIFEYLEASTETWESMHDMIQWAFPIEVPSDYNPFAPLFNRHLFSIDHSPERLRRSQRMLFRAYCRSIGILAINEDDPNQMKFAFHLETNGYTFPPNNHQHLRITRVITSLRLFGQDEIAKSFADFMLQLARDYPERINNTTVDYWYNAATEPL